MMAAKCSPRITPVRINTSHVIHTPTRTTYLPTRRTSPFPTLRTTPILRTTRRTTRCCAPTPETEKPKPPTPETEKPKPPTPETPENPLKVKVKEIKTEVKALRTKLNEYNLKINVFLVLFAALAANKIFWDGKFGLVVKDFAKDYVLTSTLQEEKKKE